MDRLTPATRLFAGDWRVQPEPSGSVADVDLAGPRSTCRESQKEVSTGGADDLHRLAEQQTNHRRGHRRSRTCHSLLQTRCDGTRVQPSRQGSMGSVRRIAPSHPCGMAISAGVPLRGYKVFAARTANCGIHLAPALRPGWLNAVARPTYAPLCFANS